MRVTVEIDEELLKSLQAQSPGVTTREIVHRALLALRHAQASALLIELAEAERLKATPRR